MSTQPNVIDPDFIKKLDEVLALATQNGGLMTIGSNQCGKSNAVMWLVRRIRDIETRESNVRVFDTCVNWRYNFDKVPFLDYSMWMGELPIARDLIIDLTDPDPLMIKTTIAEIINQDYESKRILKTSLEGKIPYYSYYIIEEMQNVFGSMALGQASGRFIYKTFCEGSNFGMVFIGLGQRLADISTKIVERRRYFLLGRANGDNDLQKLGRMFNAEVSDKVSKLRVEPANGISELLFFDKADNNAYTITFPKFQQTAKPEALPIPDRRMGHVQKMYFHNRRF